MSKPEKDGIKCPDLDKQEMLSNFSIPFFEEMMRVKWKCFEIRREHPLVKSAEHDALVLDFPDNEFVEMLAKRLTKLVAKAKKETRRTPDNIVLQLVFTGNFVECKEEN